MIENLVPHAPRAPDIHMPLHTPVNQAAAIKASMRILRRNSNR
jgi:hypothetical protein